MEKNHFQNLRSKHFGKFSGQKIENLKFSFFLLTFRRNIFREKNRSKNVFRPIFFSIFFLRKVNLKNVNFEISKKKSDCFLIVFLNLFDEFFFDQTYFSEKIPSHISIPKFPKIPKIILRKNFNQRDG